ncbi:MAG: hypothetical protein Tsb002_36040 [Wenzhouxiangellaceae bacterium]
MRISLLLIVIGVFTVNTAYAQSTSTTNVRPIKKESATAQYDALDTLVGLSIELKSTGHHIAQPCEYVAVVRNMAHGWPRTMFDVPSDAGLTASEVAKFEEMIAGAQQVLGEAFAMNATSSCLKDNDKCCDQSDPVQDSCVTHNNSDCRFVPHEPLCTAASTKCPTP